MDWIMSRSIISKATVEALQAHAPKNFDVKEKLFDVDIYAPEEAGVLFDSLYLPGEKKAEPDYLLKIIDAMRSTEASTMAIEGVTGEVTVQDLLIHKHKKAAVIMLDGERTYVHYK